jgi:hypothetical protein
MLQNMQNSHQTSVLVPPLSGINLEIPIAQGETGNTLKTVACPICQATYIPSSRQRAHAQGSLVLLETAFLCVCHFCFRCHRPSCPQCWNPIHDVCAACGEEGHLPFLAPVPSLEGLIIAPPDPLPGSQTVIMPFTCLSNGRFYEGEHIAHNLESNTTSTPFALDSITPITLPTVQINDISTTALPQSPLAENPEQQPENTIETTLVQEVKQPIVRQYISAFCRVPDQGYSSIALPIDPQEWIPETAAIALLPMPSLLPTPRPENPVVEDDKEPEIKVQALPAKSAVVRPSHSLTERVENALIAFVSVILIAITAMIVLATSSAEMNTFFLHLLHIDIRSEISYLLQLV